MKLRVVSLMGIVAIAFSVHATTIKVMSYNLRYGELASLEEIAAYIIAVQPDVIALQECDQNTFREDVVHQNNRDFVHELAEYTGMYGVFGKTIKFKGGLYGLGILSKFPIKKTKRILLPKSRNEQRIMLVAEVELPNDQSITFITTHLDHKDEIYREKQVARINKRRKRFDSPIVLGGDLNDTPDSQVIEEGFSEWFNASDSSYTFPSGKPKVKIDYIYGYPSDAFELLYTVVDDACKLSDHLPLISVLRIK